MIFDRTNLAGVYLVRMEPRRDERGFFARTICRREFEQMGLPGEFPQSSIAFNQAKCTLRGMHYAAPPSVESKLIRCTAGRVHDVVADLRPKSPTYLQHFACELTAANRAALFVPPGIAHGYLTLDDNVEMLYSMSDFYQPELDRGVRWDDPLLAIQWPEPVAVISERDRTLPVCTLTQ